MISFCCISVSAQKPLKKPAKKPQTVTMPNKPVKPQKGHSQSSVLFQATGTINGHGYVDLGLSVKWATCNVGTSSPSDYGDYFAWGETTTKSEYTEANSITYKKSMSDISGNPHYDAARAQWGDTWRLPTEAEMNELENRCKTQWTTYNGHKGRLVTGPNGKSIFLPAAGWHNGLMLYSEGDFGYYWSSTPDKSNTHGIYSLSHSLNFDRGSFYIGGGDNRYFGHTIRPVTN